MNTINDFVQSVFKALDGWQGTLSVFWDLSKAFDCLPVSFIVNCHSKIFWVRYKTKLNLIFIVGDIEL